MQIELHHPRTTRGWADEVWTVTLAVPILLAFTPGMSRVVALGFVSLGTAPDWFKEAVGAAILFAFGRQSLRGLRSVATNPKLAPVKELNQ